MLPLLFLCILGILLYFSPTVRCGVAHPLLLAFYAPLDVWRYICRKGWHNAKYGQIVCYIANSSTSFGCGKTLSSTDFLTERYRKYDGKMVWCSRRKKFVTQKIKIISNVDFLTIPFERLVSLAQFVQWTDVVEAYDDEHDTFTVTYVLVDEASSQFNSRAFKSNFDGLFISRLLTSRHVHASMYLTSQRSGMVDKLMRDCCNMYIGCDKLWRFQRLNYYDAYEIENSQTPSMVQPFRRTCWFVRDKSFAHYDTFACVQSLRKSCETGDMLSEQEIIALQCNTPANMETVSKPSRRFFRNQRKQHK